MNYGAPYFEGIETLPDLTVKVGDHRTVVLPRVLDIDGDDYVIQIEGFSVLGLYQFCQFKYPNLEISPFDSSHAGIYPVTFNLKDLNDRPLYRKYSFFLEIIDPAFDNGGID